VEPQLQIQNKPKIPKQLSMQTLLSRSMGPLERWEDLIKMQTEIGKRFLGWDELTCFEGYNCFHITPIQKLGFSQSLYALADQLEIADYIIKKNVFKKALDENNSPLLECRRTF